MSIDLEKYLYEKIIESCNSWDLEKAYSVSFFLYDNEAYEYKEYTNVPEFAISYNKEDYFIKSYQQAISYEDNHPKIKELCSIDRRNNGMYSEARWNYSDLEQDEEWIFHPDDLEYEILFQWFKEKGIENIGYEDENTMYDENMEYIGEGANGFKELLEVITNVALKIQKKDYFLKKINRRIPIIIQGLDNIYYLIDATEKVNIHGEAEDYLEYIKPYR